MGFLINDAPGGVKEKPPATKPLCFDLSADSFMI